MEASKAPPPPQDLQSESANQTLRGADGLVPDQRQAGLRPKKRYCFNSSLKAGKKPMLQFDGC